MGKGVPVNLLEAEGLSVTFGGVHAVRGVDFRVAQGELVGLIGPNGAGKTSLVRLLTGAVRPGAGSVRFDGHEVTRSPVYDRARRGLAMTHQLVRPFPDMSLVENVALAAAHAVTTRPVAALLRTGRGAARRRAVELLERLGIAELAERRAATLPLGVQKRLEMGRALAIEPRLLLLDEPLAGLNQTEAGRLADLIVTLNREGLTVVLVEHNLAEVLRIAGRLVVMVDGAVLASGDGSEVMRRADVRAAYLGESRAEQGGVSVARG